MSKIVENYLIKEILGSGNYGNVHLGVHLKTKEKFAIKVIPSKKFKEDHMMDKFTKNEILTLKRLNKVSNPNIIRFIEIMRSSNNTYYVYEFCNQGNLFEKLKVQKFFKEEIVIGYLK